MNEKIKRVYVDNSVVSGMFDGHMPERVAHMELFWQAVIDGKFRIIASDVLIEEVNDAPARVRVFFDSLPESQVERIALSEEAKELAEQYIAKNVIGKSSLEDCLHIAIATITNADAVVSWNCDDMVNPNRIPKYNDVNEKHGYKAIQILTPNQFMEENK